MLRSSITELYLTITVSGSKYHCGDLSKSSYIGVFFGARVLGRCSEGEVLITRLPLGQRWL